MVSDKAFARVNIEELLKAAGWRLTESRSRFEYPIDDALAGVIMRGSNWHDHALALLEAKSASVDLSARGAAVARRQPR